MLWVGHRKNYVDGLDDVDSRYNIIEGMARLAEVDFVFSATS